MCSGWRPSSSATASANRTAQSSGASCDLDRGLGRLDVLERTDLAGLGDVALHAAQDLQALGRLADNDAVRRRCGANASRAPSLADLAEHPGGDLVHRRGRHSTAANSFGRGQPRGGSSPRCHHDQTSSVDVRQERREQPQEHVEARAAARRSPTRPPRARAAVRAPLDELEVVVGEPPEEAFDPIERAGVLVVLERGRRLRRPRRRAARASSGRAARVIAPSAPSSDRGRSARRSGS